MGLRSLRRLAFSFFFLALAASLAAAAQDTTHRGRKYKAPPPTSRVEVTILRNDDGHAIENAAVVFQLVGDKGNLELKTNEDGKALLDVLPTGSKVLVQVIAKGFQTFGGDYNVDKSEKTIQIRLKRPGQQYSIYEQHPDSASAKPDSSPQQPQR
ncbi:MAG TPA: carboxypeptidase-like regulatory domain-containing protein [Terracidiphilus sp.]|nr:carboxypeptidase-like regulatory domain-containing protein [Terracidiphilus sp.]